MKLSEIEAVNPEDFVVFEDEMPYSYVIDRWYKTGAKEVDDFPKFYTAEQMQEYAKECVIDALKEYAGPYSDKKANSIISRVVK
ncbi:Hypothetical protein NCDO2118_1680 [Lactococcus lactis subsp. lactis NCDO 2118]|uniref:Phage protein n=1 Tax=Lactococcus lactis subsp. lactis NCDO 2118 TaxID=1117941 RepID=A0ABC8A7E1_LACLL|nr:hypothetical protein [Lactococcus lactis]AII13139.1 Hypothetical protein NCDO2118_1680 [Lactococcus lactis subsp. lactis NCDO 2118]